MCQNTASSFFDINHIDNNNFQIIFVSSRRLSGQTLREQKGSALYLLKSPKHQKVYTRHRGRLISSGLPICVYIRVFGDT